MDASRAVRLKKNICALQKAAVTVAKTTNNNEVFISGLNTDQFITVSANGEGGEISRRVALSSPLTFNFATVCEATELKKINSAVNAFYIALSGNFAFIGEKTISMLCHRFFENVTPTAEAAAQFADPGDCELNIFTAFAATVAPAEDAVKEDNNAATVTPAEDAAKEDNNAAVASWRSVWFKLFQVAAAFFCFILCNIFIKGDVVAVSLLDNVSFAPFADRAAARASPGVTPGVSGGNKQTPERTDNAAAPDAMPP